MNSFSPWAPRHAYREHSEYHHHSSGIMNSEQFIPLDESCFPKNFLKLSKRYQNTRENCWFFLLLPLTLKFVCWVFLYSLCGILPVFPYWWNPMIQKASLWPELRKTTSVTWTVLLKYTNKAFFIWYIRHWVVCRNCLLWRGTITFSFKLSKTKFFRRQYKDFF